MKKFFATIVTFAIVLSLFVPAVAQRGGTVSAKALLGQEKNVSIRVTGGFADGNLIRRLAAQEYRMKSGGKWAFTAEGDGEDFVIVVSCKILKNGSRTQTDNLQKAVNKNAREEIQQTRRATDDAKNNLRRNIPRGPNGIFRDLGGALGGIWIERQGNKRIQQQEDRMQSDRFSQERNDVIVTVQWIVPGTTKPTHEWVGSVVLNLVTREEFGVVKTKIADNGLAEDGLPEGTVITDRSYQGIAEIAFKRAIKEEGGFFPNQTIGR